ncbi:cytochrome b [Endozoicomonas ascidiicola]|uniref:cytochrome b n=1 Tax=Endozoicomonas ascidiicola TaxID=1698521 RepID=UPI00082E23F7|nr:cytochrome b [Endozoicomonas ascidiicola]
MSSSEKYTVPMRLMHWVASLMILALIGVGWYMTGLDRSVSYKFDLYHWHKSFGVLVLFLFVARLVMRHLSKVPELPATMPSHEKKLGSLIHVLLYLLMLAVPLSGYLMSSAGGRDVPLFNLVMPSLMEKNEELAGVFHEIHVLIPYIMLGIIALHILGALKHRFFDKPEHDVLKRMM